jgi:DNA polymerase elongation subunit (family B)
MSRVVIDIETLAYPLESFDERQQTYLLKFARTEEERIEAIQKMNLFPTTAHLLAIGMWNPDTSKGKVLFKSEERLNETSADGSVQYMSGTESEMLARFWEDVAKYHQFITFNGRGFDCPFLMLRSAILGIRPSRNLMPYRYDATVHCDLLEQFTFYGAFRKFSLDFYCKSFGIESPKSRGITGLDLDKLYQERRYREIGEYCLGDVKATAELFQKWESFLLF